MKKKKKKKKRQRARQPGVMESLTEAEFAVLATSARVVSAQAARRAKSTVRAKTIAHGKLCPTCRQGRVVPRRAEGFGFGAKGHSHPPVEARAEASSLHTLC